MTFVGLFLTIRFLVRVLRASWKPIVGQILPHYVRADMSLLHWMYVFAYMHACVCLCVCACVCSCVRACVLSVRAWQLYVLLVCLDGGVDAGLAPLMSLCLRPRLTRIFAHIFLSFMSVFWQAFGGPAWEGHCIHNKRRLRHSASVFLLFTFSPTFYEVSQNCEDRILMPRTLWWFVQENVTVILRLRYHKATYYLLGNDTFPPVK